MSARSVCVIGAGIVGVTAALALLRDGHRVTLVEPGDPGGEQAASFGNGAWLSPGSVVPMSLPGTWKQVPGYLLDPEGPLVIRWRALPRLAPWLFRFLRAGRRIERVEATARALSALLRDAPARHHRLAEAAGVPELVRQQGLLVAYTDRAAFARDALAWRLRRDNGVAWTEIEGEALRALVPALDPRYTLGLHLSAGAHCLDPGAYVAALARHAVSSGAQVLRSRAHGFVVRGGRLVAVRCDGGEQPCEVAVIAAGIASAALAHEGGDAVLLASERGYHVMLAGPAPALALPVMPADGKMAMTLTRGGLRVAGQVELAAVGDPPDWRRADILLGHARRVFAGLPQGGAIASRWMGHRPSTPDSLPVIGPSAALPGLMHAFGHGHVGLAAAPATAELVADQIAGRTPAIDPRPYRVDRF
ncbi:MAG: FAD-binding oxidoreductase [Planctomycetes bacterium]|nr:FAD-binding oxidoreductase [Planctomycetota bacterium]